MTDLMRRCEFIEKESEKLRQEIKGRPLTWDEQDRVLYLLGYLAKILGKIAEKYPA